MSTQPIRKFTAKSKDSLQLLPMIFHLFVFVTFVMLAVLSFNFEVFRVVRLGDLFIIIFAYVIGVNWYGQRMLEAGYQDGLRKATESVKPQKKK
jgi:hypothetical protein